MIKCSLTNIFANCYLMGLPIFKTLDIGLTVSDLSDETLALLPSLRWKTVLPFSCVIRTIAAIIIASEIKPVALSSLIKIMVGSFAFAEIMKIQKVD